MSNVSKLDPVIRIDEEKCTNCYACITACPVKYCMNGSGEKADIVLRSALMKPEK